MTFYNDFTMIRSPGPPSRPGALEMETKTEKPDGFRVLSKLHNDYELLPTTASAVELNCWPRASAVFVAFSLIHRAPTQALSVSSGQAPVFSFACE